MEQINPLGQLAFGRSGHANPKQGVDAEIPFLRWLFSKPHAGRARLSKRLGCIGRGGGARIQRDHHLAMADRG